MHFPARPAAEPQCRHEPIPPAWRRFRLKRDGTVAGGVIPTLSGRDVLQTWFLCCCHPFDFVPDAGPAMFQPTASQTGHPGNPEAWDAGPAVSRCLNQHKESSPP